MKSIKPKKLGSAHVDDGTRLGKWVKIIYYKHMPNSAYLFFVTDIEGNTWYDVPLRKLRIKTGL